ncbi:MAG TPA: hypothetical protein PKE04_16505 [Clostridia bacterium]|nr:hypothetical protein [Clostridia bacterium]
MERKSQNSILVRNTLFISGTLPRAVAVHVEPHGSPIRAHK